MRRLIHLAFVITLLGQFNQAHSQFSDDSFVTAQGLATTNSTAKTVFSIPTCGTANQTLGANTSPDGPAPAAGSGAMNNDKWFKFRAMSQVLKIRVCGANFDAAVEVYTIPGVLVTSFNIGGDGAVEYGLVTGLTYNTSYLVRVGRVSGTGAGTFNITAEHFTTFLSYTYSPSPPSGSCYTPASSVVRFSTAPSTAVMNARWIFVNGTDTIGPCLNPSGPMPLSNCFAFCLGTDYTAYCELLANDAELGPIWWGNSLGQPMDFCDTACPIFQNVNNNSTYANIRTASFTVNNLGAGCQYQWKFVSNNGATELCSPWITSTTFNPNPEFASCLEFNKFYTIYVRGRFCPSEDPSWCGPRTVFSGPMPHVRVTQSECCKWRNKVGNIQGQYDGFAMNQYRFRLTPIANAQIPCPSSNLAPIGPAITTGWLNYPTVNAAQSAIIAGTTYNVQIQGRLLSANCTNCDGTGFSMPIRMVDWGPPCLVAFRTTASPAVGTQLSGCFGCSIVAMDTWNEEEYSALIAQYGTIEIDASEAEFGTEHVPVLESIGNVLHVFSIDGRTLQLDIAHVEINDQYEIRIHDINGRLIVSQMSYATEDKNSILITAEKSFTSGIYVISLIGQDAIITERIFISGN